MTIDINEFENRVEEHLTSGLLDHYRARLARKHGRGRLATRWFAEMRTRIDRELVVTLLHTVHRSGERRRVYERCVSNVKSHDAVLRAIMTRHVEEELGVPQLNHRLDDADTAAFWKRVAAVVDDCLNDPSGDAADDPDPARGETPEQIIAGVLHRFVAHDNPARQRFARHVLVLDDELEALAPALQAANFRVIPASASELSGSERAAVLGHRILVTRNTRDDHISEAPVYEYGIVSLDALPHIDASPDYATNATAQLLSRAFTAHELGSKLSFVLLLHPEGRHVFQSVG